MFLDHFGSYGGGLGTLPASELSAEKSMGIPLALIMESLYSPTVLRV